jgi:dCMP deaminase
MKWINHWLKHAQLFASMSPCPRGKVGAFIIDCNNNPISAGFNGAPRKSLGLLCGGANCDRDKHSIKSGTRIEIGCHHAEQNAIANAARRGIALEGCTIIISTNPCLACSRLIHHSGLACVAIPSDSSYNKDGIDYLKKNNIKIISN